MQALIFRSVEELTSFVGALEGAISKAKVSLYVLSELNADSPHALALTGYKKSGPLKGLITPDLEGFLSPLKGGRVTLSSPDGASQTLKVLHLAEGLGFEGLAPLRPWGEPPEGLSDRPVLFLARRPEDVTQLALDSFKLNNDQLELATVKAEGGAQRYLLRALNPSYFLVQRFLDERPKLRVTPPAEEPSVQVFYELKPRLFVAWGFEPSAPQRWVSAEPPQGGLSALTPQLTAPALTFGELHWESVYERAQFKLGAHAEGEWRPAECHELSFEVPLVVNRVARPRPAELWLLEADDLDALERLLSALDEEELNELLISVQEREGGAGRYFLKERPGAQGGRYLDLGGRAFSSYLGHHNLYVPCEVELQPKLRRDRYPELFKLKSGELTVLDTSGASGEETRLYRFAEQSFEPLSALTAYQVLAAEEQLTSASRRAVFDLSPYDASPALADVLERLAPLLPQRAVAQAGAPLSGSVTSASPTSLGPLTGERAPEGELWPHGEEELDEGEADEEPEEGSAQQSKRVKGLARTKRRKRKGGKRSATEEATLRSELLNGLLKARSDEERVEAWVEMMSLSHSSSFEAQEALFELAWLHREELGVADEVKGLTKRLGAPLSEALYSTLDTDELKAPTPLEGALSLLKAEGAQLPKLIAALVATVKVSQLSVGERHEPLVTLVGAVEELEEGWGKRARWLLWRHLSALSTSERQLVRAREQVLGALNEEGVTVNDIPGQIVKHLNAKRMVQTKDKSEEARAELALALEHLSALQGAVFADEGSPNRSLLSRVLLTRVYHELELKQERDALFDGLVDQLAEQPHLPCAWGVSVLIGAHGLLKQRANTQCGKLLSSSTMAMSAADRGELRALQLVKLQRDQRDRARSRSDLTKQRVRSALGSDLVKLPELSAELKALQDLTRAADYVEVERRFEALLEQLAGLFEQATLAQPLCYVTDQLDALCVKLKWFPNAAAFISPLQGLSDALRALLEGELTVQQAALLRRADASVASGQIKLIGERRAKEQLAELWGELEGARQPWEVLIPTFELALRVIHSLELSDRAQAIERLTGALLTHHPDERSFRASSLTIIDQLVEACVSKEELATSAYQEYCEREELALRDAIFSAQL